MTPDRAASRRVGVEPALTVSIAKPATASESAAAVSAGGKARWDASVPEIHLRSQHAPEDAILAQANTDLELVTHLQQSRPALTDAGTLMQAFPTHAPSVLGEDSFVEHAAAAQAAVQDPDQPVRQLTQRCDHRRVRGHLLHPAATVGRWQADAAHDLGLADVQGRDPLDDLLIIAGLSKHRTHPLCPPPSSTMLSDSPTR